MDGGSWFSLPSRDSVVRHDSVQEAIERGEGLTDRRWLAGPWEPPFLSGWELLL